MRYRVRHRSTYAYDDLVDLSYHVLHLLPRPLPYQLVLDATVAAAPAPTALAQGIDYFGNRVGFLTLEEPHGDLAIEMNAEVDVGFPAPPDAMSTPAWESVRDALAAFGSVALVEAGEFAVASPLAAPTAPIAAYAAGSFA